MGTTVSERMTRDEFYQFAIDNIPDYLDDAIKESEDYEVILDDVKKTSGSYKGLRIFNRPGLAVPVVNLDREYDSYERGECLKQILERMAKLANSPAPKGFNTSDLMHYDLVKDKLYVVVVDKNNCNCNLTYDCEGLDDIVFVVKVLFGEDKSGVMSCRVDKELFLKWGVDKERVIEDALENTQKMFPLKIQHICEALGIPVNDEAPLTLIVGNEKGFFGAASMFYDGTMSKVASRMGGDFFAIPSSVHEWICLPDNGCFEHSDLTDMLNTVNSEFVSADEILDNAVYHYSVNDGVFEKVCLE